MYSGEWELPYIGQSAGSNVHVLLELIQVITLIADLLLQVVEPNRRESLAQCRLLRGLDAAEKSRGTYFSSSFSRMYMDSWAASRLVNESLQDNEGQKMMSCSRDKVDTQCGRQRRERHSSHDISLMGMVQSMWDFRHKRRMEHVPRGGTSGPRSASVTLTHSRSNSRERTLAESAVGDDGRSGDRLTKHCES